MTYDRKLDLLKLIENTIFKVYEGELKFDEDVYIDLRYFLDELFEELGE